MLAVLEIGEHETQDHGQQDDATGRDKDDCIAGQGHCTGRGPELWRSPGLSVQRLASATLRCPDGWALALNPFDVASILRSKRLLVVAVRVWPQDTRQTPV